MRTPNWHRAVCYGVVITLAIPCGALAQSAEIAVRAESTLLLDALVPTPLPNLGGGNVLELSDVLASVDLHHPALEILEARTDVAEGALLSAEGAFDPLLAARGSLSLFGYYEYGRADVSVVQATPLYGASFFLGWRLGRGLDTGGIPEYYGYDETLDGGELRGGVTVPLLRDGWIDGRRAGITRAERGVEAAEAELDARQLRVRFAATEVYWRWVAAGLRLAVAHHLLALAEVRDEQLAARVRAGALPPIEHLENRRSVLERRQVIIAARRSLERTAIALSLYLRDADGTPVVPDATRLPPQIAEPWHVVSDEEAAVAAALELGPAPTLPQNSQTTRSCRVSTSLLRQVRTSAGPTTQCSPHSSWRRSARRWWCSLSRSSCAKPVVAPTPPTRRCAASTRTRSSSRTRSPSRSVTRCRRWLPRRRVWRSRSRVHRSRSAWPKVNARASRRAQRRFLS